MKRAVIICGADIFDYEFVSSYLRADDFFIYCDSGLKHEDNLTLICGDFTKADLIVGDFDSHEKPDFSLKNSGCMTEGCGDEEKNNPELIVLPREKDDTDSVFAMKEAIKRGYKEIIFVGSTGNRLDHTLVNLYALLFMKEQGVNGLIIDNYSEISLIYPGNPGKVTNNWPYFSLVAINGNAEGVSISGAKFPLSDAVIETSYQYATSNEVSGNAPAVISVKSGELLLIKDRE